MKKQFATRKSSLTIGKKGIRFKPGSINGGTRAGKGVKFNCLPMLILLGSASIYLSYALIHL